jgi:hypothetical protein
MIGCVMPSKVASDTISAQISAMNAELGRLAEQKSLISQREEAIRLMKGALMPLVGMAGEVIASKGDTKRQAANGGSSPHVGTGFRDAVKAVFRDIQKPLNPKDVVTALTNRGELARYSGKLSPSSRVHSELYSLKKTGFLSRRAGRYSLAGGSNAVT